MKIKSPVIRGFSEGYFSPPSLSLSQWADEYAYLSPESSAEPGRWKSYPYQVGVMDAITDPAIWKVTLMKSARVGFTKVLNHCVGYFSHYDPCSMLLVQPTVEDAQGHSKDEIAPMLRDTPALAGLFSDPKTRDSDNTILKKIHPGGSLMLVGANSPRGFRRITVRVVLFDEIDGYPPSAGSEGDQIKLGTMRTDTFWNRKVIIGSTPTVKGASRVEASYLESDQRKCFVPCPLCGDMQVLVWAQVKWREDEPMGAWYECVQCGGEIPHKAKKKMLRGCEWRPAAGAAVDTGHAGFHIWAGYSLSPNATWGHLAFEHVEAVHEYKSGRDPEKFKLRTFINTRLAETWEELGDRVDAIVVSQRAEHYKAEVPQDAYVITSGVDVQDDRLELEVVAWGDGMESWSLDYFVIDAADTANEKDQCWRDLEAILDRAYQKPDGTMMHIAAMAIDTGGHATDAVYLFCRKFAHRRVYAIKGSPQLGAPLVKKPQSKTRRKGPLGFFLYLIGTEAAKQTIYARLKVESPGAGYCHFPTDRSPDYFDQLTSEEMVVKYKKGVPYKTFQMKPGKKRNEALDCRVYAYIALVILNPMWKKIKSKMSKKTEAVERVEEAKQEPEPVAKAYAKRRPRKRKGGWVNAWKR